jgi:pseudouridine kinase
VGENHVICIGAALIDESFVCDNKPVAHTSNPSEYYRSAGGVARNVAHHLALLGNSVGLITYIGNDEDGKWLTDICGKAGINLLDSVIDKKPTGRYAAILNADGELFIGAAAINFELITVEFLKEKADKLKTAELIMLDCNLDEKCIQWLLDFCREEKIACIVETVSVKKAERIRNANLKDVLLITPNFDELQSVSNQNNSSIEDLTSELINRGVKNVWLRKGKEGSVIYSGNENFSLESIRTDVVDVTGAGDAALAGWIHGYLQNCKMNDCLRYGHALASIILQTKGAILETLSADLLESKIKSMQI